MWTEDVSGCSIGRGDNVYMVVSGNGMFKGRHNVISNKMWRWRHKCV